MSSLFDEIRRHLEMLLWIFIVLKLTGLVPWSWWWVLAPLWVPAVITAVTFIDAGIVTLIRRIRKTSS